MFHRLNRNLLRGDRCGTALESELRTGAALTALMLWVWRLPLPDWLRWLLLWLKNPHFVATVAAVIINERGEVLLFRHTYRRDLPWGLPGGWLERSEDPDKAIEREMMEEAGLTVRVLYPLIVGRDRNRRRLDVVYIARLEGGAFRPSQEVSEMRYFSAGALPVLSNHTRDIILMAMERVAQESGGEWCGIN